MVSTGTWSITFNPFNKEPLTYEELERDCLCYINIFGEQVKSSRLFLGNEYSRQIEKLNEYFGKKDKDTSVKLNEELLKKLVKSNDHSRKLKLEEAFNSGPYPQNKPGEWNVSSFESYEEAYHQLMLDLVAIQAESIKLAEGSVPTKKLVITGGFSQNDFFIQLLACFFPEKEVYTSSLPNASALGAAMVVNDEYRFLDNKNATKQLLALKKHKACKVKEAAGYRWKEKVLS